jgi:hypothetical protein
LNTSRWPEARPGEGNVKRKECVKGIKAGKRDGVSFQTVEPTREEGHTMQELDFSTHNLALDLEEVKEGFEEDFNGGCRYLVKQAFEG